MSFARTGNWIRSAAITRACPDPVRWDMSPGPSTAYGWFMLAGVLASLGFWLRRVRGDERLRIIYVAALGGAFFGAKLVYLGAEGWLHWNDPDRWTVLATGKSITGAL